MSTSLVPDRRIERIDDITRAQILSDIRNDRRSWKFTEMPQLVILTILLIALGSVATAGLIFAVVAMKDPKSSGQVAKVLQVLVGGTSSVIGFAVLKLSVRLSEMTKRYLLEVKRFTSDINRTKLCSTKFEIENLLKQYSKPAK